MIDIGTALDTWATDLATATGYTVTRDPGQIHPPCLYIDLPVLIAPTQAAIGVEIPLFVVGAGSGKQAGDILLGMLPTVLAGAGVGTAEPATLTIGDIPFQAYKITVPATITEDPTPPTP